MTIVKRILKSIIKMLGLSLYASALQDRNRKYWEAQRIKSWLESYKTRSVFVHPSIEFTGCAPFDCVELGRDTHIQQDVTIWLAPDKDACPKLTIGCDSFIGRNSFLGVHQPITIGSYVQIAAYCYLVSQNHGYARRDIPIKHQDFVGGPIVIEDDVWLGTHVVVLPNVIISKGAIVAAGSVVTKNIPAYEIWGGVPAKFLKMRP
jgi:carbonic anhydrase/acetyltransferase-like protein (isoleucine patch superfamily)